MNAWLAKIEGVVIGDADRDSANFFEIVERAGRCRYDVAQAAKRARRKCFGIEAAFQIYEGC